MAALFVEIEHDGAGRGLGAPGLRPLFLRPAAGKGQAEPEALPVQVPPKAKNIDAQKAPQQNMMLHVPADSQPVVGAGHVMEKIIGADPAAAVVPAGPAAEGDAGELPLMDDVSVGGQGGGIHDILLLLFQ